MSLRDKLEVIAGIVWWNKLSKKEQLDYIKQHPKSKFRYSIKKSDKIVKKTKDVPKNKSQDAGYEETPNFNKDWDNYLKSSPDSFKRNYYKSNKKKTIQDRAYGIAHAIDSDAVSRKHVHGDGKHYRDYKERMKETHKALSFLPNHKKVVHHAKKASAADEAMYRIAAQHPDVEFHPEMPPKLLVKDWKTHGPFSPMKYDFDRKLTPEQIEAGKQYAKHASIFKKHGNALKQELNKTLIPHLRAKYPKSKLSKRYNYVRE
jgi:hypothetical protein